MITIAVYTPGASLPSILIYRPRFVEDRTSNKDRLLGQGNCSRKRGVRCPVGVLDDIWGRPEWV